MTDLVTQPTSAPMRKITIISLVGSIASIVFASAPAIIAQFPSAAPWINAAMVIAPAVLGPLGYQLKEWGATPPAEADPVPLFRPSHPNQET